MPSKKTPDVPDLRSLLAEASRPSETVTVPLKQGLSEKIRQGEVELERMAHDPANAKSKRAGGPSPLMEKAREVEALRAEMEASALTFRFEALTEAERDQIRKDMSGRDNADEMNLRAVAAMCRSVTGPGGVEFEGGMAWTDLRDLRDRIGAQAFDLTIDAAANLAAGGQWSVPFSPNASHILAIGR